MSALGTFDRSESIRRLSETTFDLLVIGGGITGAGVALDAASRGLRTALVERDDFASGTSSKSSKLVHGGLRYLQNGDVKLVYQALAERNRLLKNAPHLVEILPFCMPIFTRDGIINKKLARALGSAMWAYDLTGGMRIGKRHERLSVDETLERLPFLQRDRVAGSYLYYDARADDARLTLSILRTAALDYGATVVNHTPVVGLVHSEREVESSTSGAATTQRTVSGARVRFDMPGDPSDELEIQATLVVNATGVWADKIRAHDEGQDPDSIRPAKGIHVSVAHHKLPCTVGGIIPVRGDKRSVFVVPEGGATYIGTTDTDYEGSLVDPAVTSEDVDYLLNAVNGATTATLTRDDILGTWAGLRPLVKAAAGSRTADLSRSHKIHRSPSRLVSITGGKLTTYREMASDTVDEVVDLVDNEISRPIRKRCRTTNLRLRGAEGHATVRLPSVGADAGNHLRSRFGGEADVVDALIAGRPDLAEPLAAGLPYLRAEVVWAARYEMAMTLTDVLSRRTRALLYNRDAALGAAGVAAQLMAEELDWSPQRIATEISSFRAVVDAELAAELATESQPDPTEEPDAPLSTETVTS